MLNLCWAHHQVQKVVLNEHEVLSFVVAEHELCELDTAFNFPLLDADEIGLDLDLPRNLRGPANAYHECLV